MLDLQLSGEIARLILSRPDVRNAVQPDAWATIAERAEEAVSLGARVILLSGAGGSFCAGADLDSFQAMHDDPAARARFRIVMRDSFERVSMLPVPVIAVIEGACFGAGVALAMACDIRIAAPDSRFGITPAKLGIAYPQEDIHRLVTLVGRGQAARLLYGASTVDGAEALRIGLADLLAADVASAAADFAGAILANSPDSIAALKRGVRLAADNVRADREQERVFDALIGSDAFAGRLAQRRTGR
jgi:enoyl-CoA hydratase/carnithine racemase